MPTVEEYIRMQQQQWQPQPAQVPTLSSLFNVAPRGATAEEKRKKALEDAIKAQERIPVKAAAVTTALPVPSGVDEELLEPLQEDLAREAAARVRWESQTLPQALEEQEAPESVVEITEQALGEEKEPHWAWQALEWVGRQLGRPWAAVKTALREPIEEAARLQEARESGDWWTYAQGASYKSPGSPETVVKALRAFAHPETAPEYLVRPEEQPEFLSERARRALSTGIEIAGESAFDPTMYIGIGAVPRVARTATEAMKLGERIRGLETAAREAGKLVKPAESRLAKLDTATARAQTRAAEAQKNLQKLGQQHGKVLEQADKLRLRIGEVAQTSLENTNAQIVKLQERLAQTSEKLAATRAKEPTERVLNTIRKLEEQQVQYQTKLDDALGRARAIGDAVGRVVGGKPLTEGLENVPAGLRNLVQDLERQNTKAVELSNNIRKMERRTRVPARLEPKVTAATQELERARDVANRLRSEYSSAKELARPQYALTVGAFGRSMPIASVEPVISGLREMSRKAILSSPVLSRAATTGVRALRPMSPMYRIGERVLTPQEHRATGEMIQELHPRIREAQMLGVQAGKERLQPYAKAGVPREALEQASVYHELPLEEKAAFLDKIDPEMRPLVQRTDEIYTGSMADITQRLVDEFGEDFAQRVIENYVPHIVQAPKKKVDQFLDTWAEKIGKERVPGAKPSFMYERLNPDVLIRDLEEAGLKPIKNLAVLDATYRAQAERMIALKHTTDWLEDSGFIARKLDNGKYALGAEAVRPREIAGWEDGGKLFPWLSGAKVHPEVARAFTNLKPTIEFNSDEIKAFAKAFNAVTSTFKGMVTSTRTTFHFINQMGNMILMRMAGIPYTKQAEYYAKALKGFVTPTEKDKELINLFERYGLRGQGMFTDSVQAAPSVAKEMENELQKLTGGTIGKIKAVVMPKTAAPWQVPFESGRWLGENVDTVSRMAAFRHFIDQGIEPSQAAELVKRYMFDYSMLTPSERFARQWFIPFYSWARYSLPRSILAMVEQPGAYTGMFRLQEALADVAGVDQSQLPSWLQTAFVLGTDEEGKVVYVNPQPPWGQLVTGLSVEDTGGGINADRDLYGMLNPIPGAVVMGLTGRDPETGKEIIPAAQAQLMPWEQRLSKVAGEIAKQFTPWWELEKLYPAELTPEKVSTTGRVVQGWPGWFTSFLSTYDQPLAQAYETLRNEDALDAYRKLQEEQGQLMPETAQVQQTGERLQKEETALNILSDINNQPSKVRFLEQIATSTGGFNNLETNEERLRWLLENILIDHGDLFTGTSQEVADKLNQLYTPQNYVRLWVELGHKPNLYEFLSHRSFLESGKEAVPQEVERLQRTLKTYADLMETAGRLNSAQ